MDKLSDLIKRFLNFLLTSLKTLLTIIYGFFVELFQGSKTNQELKSQILEKTKEKKERQDISIKDFSEFQDEEPEVLTFMPNNYHFDITNDEIDLLIESILCEELELDKQFLTKKEEQYIKDLQETLIPTLTIRIEKQIIDTREKLQDNIRVLVRNDLENQLKLEQNYSSDNEKIVITPLIYERDPETIYPTFNPHTFFKEKRKEIKTNIDEVAIPKPIVLDDIPKSHEAVLTTQVPVMDPLVYEPVPEPKIKTGDTLEILEDPYSNTEDFVTSSSYEEAIEKLDILPITSSDKQVKPEVIIKPVPAQAPIIEEQALQQDKVQPEIVEQILPFDTYQEKDLDKQIRDVQKQWELENQKEELEDKDYQTIEKQIQILLGLIEKLKLKNLTPEQKKNILKKEKDLVDLKNILENKKQKDIYLEQEILNEAIFQDNLNKLELELQNSYLNDQNNLQQYMINRLEDLDYIEPERAKQIEKELLKKKLQDAIKSLELSTFLSLPFLNNRYLLYLTMGIFTNRHLKSFQAILNRKTVAFEPFLLEHIKKGFHAFYEAIALTEENINFLNVLQNQVFLKYPELSRDYDFNNYIEHLRLLLLKNREKLLKKDKMINKYNLKTQKYLRKRKKPKNDYS